MKVLQLAVGAAAGSADVWEAIQAGLTRVATIWNFQLTAIDELFREHGIVIAFPQRDVHLDGTEALKVRVLRDEQAPD